MNIINELQNNHDVLLVVIGFFGLIVGSFVNVTIYRLPIMLKAVWHKECEMFLHQEPKVSSARFNLLYPRSHCPQCKKLVPWWLNIPVVSYLVLRGHCKNCGAKIPWHYPVVELSSGIGAAVIAAIYGFSLMTLVLCTLTWALIALIFIDLEHKLIPDNITLPLLWLGLLLNAETMFVPPATAIMGAIVGYLLPWLIARLFKMVRKVEGMGYGDFKLFAMFGAWFGWQSAILTLIFSALIGSIIGVTLVLCKKYRLQQELPFGPYIAIVGWLNIFYGQQLWMWYTNILGW